MMEENNQHVDFTSVRDVLTSVFKHKYKILGTFLVIFAVALYFASQVRQTYEAKSVVLIKLGREFLNRPDAENSGGSSIPLDSIARSEISILTSHDLMDKVVKTVGPTTLYPELNNAPAGVDRESAAVGSFERSLRVSTLGSTLVEVRYVNDRPDVAALAVNTLVAAFKDKHLEVFGGKSTEFLENQKHAFEQKLEESENRLAGFQEKNDIYSSQEQENALIEQRTTLDQSLKESQNQVSELEQKIAFIRGSKWSTDMHPETRNQLLLLKQRERELMEKRTDSSKAVQDVRREIREVQESEAKDSQDIRQRDLEKAESELAMAKARVSGLNGQLQQVDGKINFLERRTIALNGLKRQVSQEEDNYRTYSHKLEESLILDDMDRRKMVAISVIEKAMPATAPRKMRFGKEEVAAGGFFGGIAGGIALALLLEFMAPGMTTPLSAQRRLDLPVLVAIGRKP